MIVSSTSWLLESMNLEMTMPSGELQVLAHLLGKGLGTQEVGLHLKDS